MEAKQRAKRSGMRTDETLVDIISLSSEISVNLTLRPPRVDRFYRQEVRFASHTPETPTSAFQTGLFFLHWDLHLEVLAEHHRVRTEILAEARGWVLSSRRVQSSSSPSLPLCWH